MGAWRHAWEAATGAPPTRERLVAGAALDEAAHARARRLVDRGELPEDPAEARLVTALARERVARLDLPAARRPWTGWLLVAVVVAVAVALLLVGEAAVAAIVAVVAAATAWPVLRQPARRRRAQRALALGEDAMRAAGVAPVSRTALGDVPAGRVVLLQGGLVAAIFGCGLAVRLAFGEDLASSLAGAAAFAAVYGSLFVFAGRQRYVRALRALAA